MRYRFRSCELDTRRFELRRNSARVHVRRGVFDLIVHLLEHREGPVAKEELLARVWQGRAVEESSLSRAVSSARAALGDTPEIQHTIKTVHGRGYWFVAPVERVAEPAEEGRASPGAHRLPFVGRVDAMQELLDALDRGAEGRGSTWLLTGEAGVGKSRMLVEFAERARSRGAEVLLAHAHDADLTPPLWLWIQVLRSHLGARAGTLPAGEPGRVVRDLLGAVPELRAVLPTQMPGAEDAASGRFRLFDAAAELLRRGSRERLLAILLDDLQDADPTSLELLRFLTRSLDTWRVLVVGACREPAGPRASATLPALGSLSREAHSRVLALAALTLPDVQAMLEQLGLAAELASPLYERSGGNPFFLTQLVPLLVPGGDRVLALPAARHLPASVHEGILDRLRDLSAETRDILASAAVVGREFPVSLLARAVGIPVEQTFSLLAAAEQAGIVEERQPGLFTFSHGLVHEAIYARLSIEERSRAHLAVARALAPDLDRRGTAGIESLAYHTWRALPLGDPAEAAKRLADAARSANRQFAFERASVHCERALYALESAGSEADSRLCELLVELARAQAGAGNRAAAYASLTRAAGLARALDATGRLAEVALAITPGFLPIETGIVDATLVEILETALEKVGEESAALRARLLARLAIALYWSEGDGARRRLLMEEAERLASRGGDATVGLEVRLARFQVRWGLDPLEERLRQGEWLRRRCNRADGRAHAPLARIFRISTYLECGRGERVDREIDALARAVKEARQPHVRWHPVMYRAMRSIMRGRYAEASERIGEYRRLASRFGDVNVSRSLVCQQCEIAWQTGGATDVIGSLESQMANFSSRLEWESTLAFAWAGTGRREDAEAALESLVPELAKADRTMNWLLAGAALADACVETRAERHAARLYECLLPYHERGVVVGYGVLYWGSVARRLGALAALRGRSEEMQIHFASAVALERRTGAAPWLAAAHLAWGTALAAGGGPGSAVAREHARRAHTLASTLGMKDLERRAAQLDARGDLD